MTGSGDFPGPMACSGKSRDIFRGSGAVSSGTPALYLFHTLHCMDHAPISPVPQPPLLSRGVQEWGDRPALCSRVCHRMTIPFAVRVSRGWWGRMVAVLSHGCTVMADLSFCLENEEGSGREMKSVPSGKGQAGRREFPSLWDLPHRHIRQLHG